MRNGMHIGQDLRTDMFCENMMPSAKQILPSKVRIGRKPWITGETMKLIEFKHCVSRTNDPERYKKASKEVKRATKKDWEAWLDEMTDKDLDLRDKWLGIRFLKKNMNP